MQSSWDMSWQKSYVAGRAVPRAPGVAAARGAVLVEFVIAIVPMMITFFGFTQVAKIYTANLAVRHGAIAAARAAIVISDENDNNPGNNGSKQEIKQAAALAMLPWIEDRSLTDVRVTIDDRSSRRDVYGPVTAKVRAIYHCRVPLAGKLICPASVRMVSGEATMPHQGARYKDSLL